MKALTVAVAATLLVLLIFFSGYFFPRRYFVGYVYHTVENGPVAGYGCMVVTGHFNGIDRLQRLALKNEYDVREEIGVEQETIRSLAIQSINRL